MYTYGNIATHGIYVLIPKLSKHVTSMLNIQLRRRVLIAHW